jgi:hypothetical protein
MWRESADRSIGKDGIGSLGTRPGDWGDLVDGS